MLAANSDFSTKIDHAYATLNVAPQPNAPHEFLAIYYPSDDNAGLQAFWVEKMNAMFPDFNLKIVDITSSSGAETKFALVHPKAHLILEQLMASVVIGIFDPDHMARYGFSPILTHQNDLFDFLKLLREELNSPMWTS